MATLVLTAVGTLIGGPVGGAIGAMVGQQIDQRLLAPKGRQGPRLGDLAVQTSTYGSQIPLIFGTMRVAGTVIWATPLREAANRSGGGKGRPSTTDYSYSASFAVALSGRRVAEVRRIWADGKLLRGAAGDFKTETGFRLHGGGEDQTADPLIAAAEGIGDAPAYRGLAYAVFEDFQLGDYGNRIPSLTFEVVADAEGATTGGIAAALSGGGIAAGAGTPLVGFAAYGDSVRAVIATLNEAVPSPLYDDGATLRMGRDEGEPASIPAADVLEVETSKAAAGRMPDAVAIGYYDPARDYQAGSQRASFGGADGGGARRVETVALPAALEAGAAKALAQAKLDGLWRARTRRTVTLPWAWMGLRPGSQVRLEPGTRRWLVTEATLERMAVTLQLVAADGGGARAALPAVPGRSAVVDDVVHGATVLHLLDAPGFDGASEPRMLVAAAGVSRGWRRAVLEVSRNSGSWEAAGSTARPAIMGRALSALGAGGSALIDTRGSVEVELLHAEMWLEGCDDDALVAGGNAAMLGDELIQFGRAELVGARRFRLSRLLRGRRGTEWAAGTHAAGDAFTLIETETLAGVTVPIAGVGGMLSVAARGIGDGEPVVATRAAGVEAVRPPAPVHLRGLRQPDGGVAFSWTRRSRAGWAWIDSVDAPLGEAREAYRVTLSGGARERVVEVVGPNFVYRAEDQAADGAVAGAAVGVAVEQVGDMAVSRPARMMVEARGTT